MQLRRWPSSSPFEAILSQFPARGIGRGSYWNQEYQGFTRRAIKGDHQQKRVKAATVVEQDAEAAAPAGAVSSLSVFRRHWPGLTASKKREQRETINWPSQPAGSAN